VKPKNNVMEEKSEKTTWMVLALIEAVVIACMLAFAGHMIEQPEKSESTKIKELFGQENTVDINDATGYNVEKDALINCAISRPYLRRTVEIHDEFTFYELLYTDYRFTVVHHNQVPYKSVESWDYFCTDVNGNDVLLTSSINIAAHNVSPATLKKLRDICLEK